MSNSPQSATIDGGNGQDVTRYEFNSPKSLMAVANQPELQADEKPIYTDDESGEIATWDGDSMSEVDGYKLVFNPATGTVFNAVTDDYAVINPGEFVGPLVEELNERDRQDVTGEVYVRNDGANAFAQILFEETDAIWLSSRGRSNPVRCGFDIRWSHDGGLTVSASGFAQDTACTNSLREITSGINVKHAGDTDRVDWREEWATVLDEVGAFSDMLGTVIEDAMTTEFFDFSEHADGILRETTDPLDTIEGVDLPGPIDETNRDTAYGVFDLMGFPSYVGVAAVDRLAFRLGGKDDPRSASVWDVYSALTYALTHSFRGTPGASDDGYHRSAKDVLLNPDKVWSDVRDEAQTRAEPDDSGVTLTPDMDADDAIEQGTGDALRTHSERSRALAETFGGD